MIRACQWRGARAMLGLSQKEFARETGLSAATLRRLERPARPDIHVMSASIIKALDYLRERGIVFLCEDGAPGLRLEGCCFNGALPREVLPRRQVVGLDEG